MSRTDCTSLWVVSEDAEGVCVLHESLVGDMDILVVLNGLCQSVLDGLIKLVNNEDKHSNQTDGTYVSSNGSLDAVRREWSSLLGEGAVINRVEVLCGNNGAVSLCEGVNEVQSALGGILAILQMER